MILTMSCRTFESIGRLAHFSTGAAAKGEQLASHETWKRRFEVALGNRLDDNRNCIAPF
jgi:hypothetical protein